MLKVPLFLCVLLLQFCPTVSQPDSLKGTFLALESYLLYSLFKGYKKWKGGVKTNKKQKISLVATGIVLTILAVTCVSASSRISSPLYMLRMEQASSEMNYLPTDMNIFTYTSQEGYNLNHTANCCTGAKLLITGVTCYDSCGGTCDYTCWDTCQSTCPNTCVSTCPDTCVSTCPNTCQSTCPNTCVSTCDTCVSTCWETCGQTCRYTCSKPCIP